MIDTPLLRSAWTTRALLGVLILICALLSLFPQRYRAATSLTPSDPGTLGLGGALGQLGAINSVFGNQAAVEVALKVGQSIYVRETVGKKLDLINRLHFPNRVAMHRWLEHNVDFRSLRGGILIIESSNRDPKLAEDLVKAYSEATRVRLAEINRRQTEYKRDVLLKLVSEASERLALAQSRYDTFRLSQRYGDPVQAITAIGARIPVLESAIKSKQVQLNTARQFATDDNMNVRQIMAEIASLQAQLNEAKTTNPTQENSVGRVVNTSTQAERYLRELIVSQTLYDNYIKYLQGTAVEDLTSLATVRVLEPPFVDTDRQIDYRFASIAIFLALLLAAMEFYRVRPPAGDRAYARETYA